MSRRRLAWARLPRRLSCSTRPSLCSWIRCARTRPYADWGPTTYFTRGLFEPTDEEGAALAKRRVEIEHGALHAVTGSADVQLVDGRVLSFAGLFLASTITITTPLVAQLGLALEDGMMGKYIKTDASKETTVPGVFACGDIALAAGSVAFAVGDGALAGVRTHQSLIFR